MAGTSKVAQTEDMGAGVASNGGKTAALERLQKTELGL